MNYENIQLSRIEYKYLKKIKKMKFCYDKYNKILSKLDKNALIVCENYSISEETGEYVPIPPYLISDIGEDYIIYRRNKELWYWLPIIIADVLSVIAIILSIFF